MKYLITLISFLFILTDVCFSQSITERHQDVFIKIDEIDKKEDYMIISLENEDVLPHMTDGGSELSGYYQDGELIKTVVKIYLSYGIRSFDYYFSNGILLYVNERFEQFGYNPETDIKDYSKIELTFNGLYIFQGSELIDYETLGHNRFENDEIDPEKVLIEEAEYFKGQLEESK